MAIIDKLSKILVPEKSLPTPKSKTLYGVVTGTYCGELLLFVEEDATNFHFISVPKLINRSVPKDKFQLGLTENIIEPAKTIPAKFVKLLFAQYKYNKNHK